jgi:hypothetical protein
LSSADEFNDPWQSPIESIEAEVRTSEVELSGIGEKSSEESEDERLSIHSKSEPSGLDERDEELFSHSKSDELGNRGEDRLSNGLPKKESPTSLPSNGSGDKLPAKLSVSSGPDGFGNRDERRLGGRGDKWSQKLWFLVGIENPSSA